MAVTAVDSASSVPGESGRDLVSELRPQLSISARTGVFRGSLDYSLSAVSHSQGRRGRPAGDDLQNTLRSALTADFLPGRLSVEASADIAQQLRDPYGDLSLDGRRPNGNRAEVARGSIRPSLRGRLADWGTYQLTMSADGTHTQDAVNPYALATAVNLNLNSASERALLGWTATVTQQRSRFSGANASDNERISLGLVVNPDVDVSITIRGGQEAYIVKGLVRQTQTNWGGSVTWTPTPRTRAVIGADQRYYGRSSNVLLDHRFRQSTLRFSSVQGSNETGSSAGIGQPQTLLQTYVNLPQFVAAQPDPILREQTVRAFLRSIGQNPDALVGAGFSTRSATLQRRDDLAYTYSARRASLTLQAFRSATRNIDLTGAVNNSAPVEQRGWSVSAAYRLTPSSSLSVNASQSQTLATSLRAGSDLKFASAGWSTALGRYANLSVTARAAKSTGADFPYRDLALGSTLSLRF